MKYFSSFLTTTVVMSSLLASPVMAMEVTSTKATASIPGRANAVCRQEAAQMYKSARQEALEKWTAEHKKMWDERKAMMSTHESAMKTARETRVNALKGCVEKTGAELTACKKAAWDAYYQAQKDLLAKRMDGLKAFVAKNETLWGQRVEWMKTAWTKHQEAVKACQAQKAQ